MRRKGSQRPKPRKREYRVTFGREYGIRDGKVREHPVLGFVVKQGSPEWIRYSLDACWVTIVTTDYETASVAAKEWLGDNGYAIIYTPWDVQDMSRRPASGGISAWDHRFPGGEIARKVV